MSDQNQHEIVRIDLTNEQKEQVKARTGKDAVALELSVEELEARIAPYIPYDRLASNHNETLLVETHR